MSKLNADVWRGAEHFVPACSQRSQTQDRWQARFMHADWRKKNITLYRIRPYLSHNSVWRPCETRVRLFSPGVFWIRSYIYIYIYCLVWFQDSLSLESISSGVISGAPLIRKYIAWYDFRNLCHTIYIYIYLSHWPYPLLGGVLECVSTAPYKQTANMVSCMRAHSFMLCLFRFLCVCVGSFHVGADAFYMRLDACVLLFRWC